MSATQVEERMSAFYDRKYDVLLSTTIIESGLDIPSANTLIVHRADRFGLAQLYQLRGRVGRAKTRAYAYLTTPSDRSITETAEKRLQVLANLDSLGAGFQLASHDLDIRGAGNLLGDEQSGHIKEVGFELYQSMLEDAILEQKAGGIPRREEFSPQISIDAPILIPETYVPDLDLRMGLYRRLGELEDRRAVDEFAAELIDRFGTLAAGNRKPAPDRRDQAQLPPGLHRQARHRRQGRGGDVRRGRLPRPRRAAGLCRALEGHGQAQARQQDDCVAQLADGRGAADRGAAAFARFGSGHRSR